MSKVAIDAATRDYIVKPRLDYRTVTGVNGPLVILEVRGGSGSWVAGRSGGVYAGALQEVCRRPAVWLAEPRAPRLARRMCGTRCSPRLST